VSALVLAAASLIAVCLALRTPALAASVTVSGESPGGAITLTIEDATVDLVLEDLRKKYGFEVGGLEHARSGDAVSATMSGSLRSILERLLRNRNHLIVRSPDNESGIAKVVILDSAYGSTQSIEQKGASGSAPSKLLQAFSGGGPSTRPHIITGRLPDE
jgi:hypothetical protein